MTTNRKLSKNKKSRTHKHRSLSKLRKIHRTRRGGGATQSSMGQSNRNTKVKCHKPDIPLATELGDYNPERNFEYLCHLNNIYTPLFEQRVSSEQNDKFVNEIRNTYSFLKNIEFLWDINGAIREFEEYVQTQETEGGINMYKNVPNYDLFLQNKSKIKNDIQILENTMAREENILLNYCKVFNLLKKYRYKEISIERQKLPSITIFFYILEWNNKLYELQHVDSEKYSSKIKELIPLFYAFFRKYKDIYKLEHFETLTHQELLKFINSFDKQSIILS